jgi:hypothetical protein
MCPEMLSGDPYNEKCDLYSIGSVMFNLVSGRYLSKSLKDSNNYTDMVDTKVIGEYV